MARQERPLRDFALLLYGAGLGFLTNLATNSADGWSPPFTLIRDHSEYLIGAGVIVPAAYYAWRQRQLRTAHEWDASRQGNPYPGLQSFGPGHERVFFGRDRAVRELHERLEVPGGAPEDRFLLVAGPSGSGKSSLVNAGLAGLLRRRNWWLSDPVAPGRDPFGALVHVFQGELPKAEGDALVRDLRVEAQRALERLWRTDEPRSTHPEVLNALLGEAVRLNRPAVLLLDQFEELVTQVDARTRQEFMALLHAALADHRRLHVVATMRAEFIGVFLPEPSGELLRDPYVVTRLNRAELRQIITGPARKAGVEIEPEAVAAMVDDATEAGADVLPLLAYLLHNLYEDYGGDGRITLQEYVESGRVAEAISSTAGKVLARLSRQYGEAQVMRTLLRFVSFAAHTDEPTRNSVRLDDLDDEEKHVVEEFLEARLLVDDSDGHRDLAHEALLRQWEPLRDCLDQQRPLLRKRTTFQQRAREWDQSGRRGDLLLPESQVDEAVEVTAAVECSALLREFCAASVESRRKARRIRAISAAQQADLVKAANPQLALAVAREIAELSPGEVTAAALWARLRDPLVWSVRRHADSVIAARWDDDGRLWAVDGAGVLMVHDIEQEQPVQVRRLPAKGNLFVAEWSSGSELIFGDGEGLKCWDLVNDVVEVVDRRGSVRHPLARSSDGWLAYDRAGQMVVRAPGETIPSALASSEVVGHAEWAPTGLLATGDDNGVVRVWNPESGETTVVHEHVSGVNSLSWSKAGLLVSADDHVVRVWDSATGETEVLRGWENTVLGATWMSREQLVIGVAASGVSSRIDVWNSRTKALRTLRYCSERVSEVFPAPGENLLVCMNSGSVELVRTDLGHHAEHRQGAAAAGGSARGTALLTVGTDGKLWRTDAGGSERLGRDAHSGTADLLAWSADGRLASARSDFQGYSEVRVWDRHRATTSLVHCGTDAITDIAWSPDGLLAWGGYDEVHVWDSQRGESRIVLEFSGRVEALEWSSTSRLAVGLSSGGLKTWDPASGAARVLQKDDNPLREIGTLAWSAAGELATGDYSGAVRVWDLESGESTLLAVHTDAVQAVAWSSDGLLASGGDQTVRLCDPKDGQSRVVDQQEEELTALAWSIDGVLASGWRGGSLRILEPGASESRLVHEHSYAVESIAWSRAGQLASSSGLRRDRVLIWDPDVSATHRPNPDNGTARLAWSPDDELTTSDLDSRIRLWSKDLRRSRAIRQHDGPVDVVAVSSTGLIASSGPDGNLRVWDGRTGDSRVISADEADVSALVWDSGDRLAVARGDRGVALWDSKSGEFADLTARTARVSTMAWSASGVLAMGGDDFVVRLWEPGSGQIRELRRHTAVVRALVWSDEDRLISAGEDGLLIWDVPGERVLVIGDAVEVEHLVRMPGQALASADDQGRIRLWDPESGHVIATFQAHEGKITVLSWREDGLLMSAGQDRRVVTWNFDTDIEALLREADERGVRRLTDQERVRFGLA
ncbi:WD40 repeat [Saccharopolyspora antimicrobica]|uniref:WD40 repeat n=1 Tax=Saccharopolyspora antimicrobica TaxID=455193 RepID=A0A1I4V7G8_9PSEU|nr:AAA family ATPase [Saccharopolyspora antimicrobica]RKT86157.1 WD40 repeat protein [Saccharopolyspora antimicrobica]SFM97113.1 WD40 repeat [Saccharopolyspora antimicrobica]